MANVQKRSIEETEDAYNLWLTDLLIKVGDGPINLRGLSRVVDIANFNFGSGRGHFRWNNDGSAQISKAGMEYLRIKR